MDQLLRAKSAGFVLFDGPSQPKKDDVLISMADSECPYTPFCVFALRKRNSKVSDGGPPEVLHEAHEVRLHPIRFGGIDAKDLAAQTAIERTSSMYGGSSSTLSSLPIVDL